MNVTIIIPTYKPQNYLWECLSSINKQDYPFDKFEVIIVLNGCKDPYESNIRNYINNKLTNLNIRIFQTNIPGVSNARNIGINNANGKNIIFIDDDDLISDNYISELTKKKCEKSIVVSNLKVFNENIANSYDDYISFAFEKHKKKSEKSFFLKRSFLSNACSKLIPKDIIGRNRFDTKINIGEDSVFMALISNNVREIVLSDENAIYFRRERHDSASRKKQKLMTRIKNKTKLLFAYSKIYLSNPFNYNFPFFVSRLIATIIK